MPTEFFPRPLFAHDDLYAGGGIEYSGTAIKYAEAAISNMRGRAIPLVKQLIPLISDGAIPLVVSDDVKGHVPAQLLHLLINSIYSRMDIPLIDLLHIRGSFGVHKEQIVQEYQNQGGITDFSLGQKALLVTESVGSGRTIRTFGQAFRQLSVPFYIASYVVSKSEDDYRKSWRLGRDTRLIHPHIPDDNDEFVDQCRLMSATFHPDRELFNDFEIAISLFTQTRLAAVAHEVLAEIIDL